MGVRNLAEGIYGEAAFWATWLPRVARAPMTALAAGRPIHCVHGSTAAEVVRARLADKGIHCDLTGTIRFSDALLTEYAESPWAADSSADDLCKGPLLSEACMTLYANTPAAPPPKARIAGRLWRCLDAIRATRLYRRLSLAEGSRPFRWGQAWWLPLVSPARLLCRLVA